MTRFHTPNMQRLRGFAETLMRDECTVTRATGETHVDSETGVTTPVFITVYAGRCKLQTSGGIGAETSVSGVQTSVGGKIPQWSLYAHFPFDTPGLEEGDVMEIQTSYNPELVGRKLRLVNMQSEKTHVTAQRWNVKEIGGEET